MGVAIDASATDTLAPLDRFARLHQASLEALADGGDALQHRMLEWMRGHDVVFAGQPIPFVLAPHCLDTATVAQVRHAVEVLTRVLDRFCSAFRTDAGLRAALNLPPAEADLVRIEPTLDDPLQLCRLDAFLLADGSLRFLEFNAESPAGIGYTDVMYEGLVRHLPALGSPNVHVSYERVVDHLVAAVGETEARWRRWATGEGVTGVPDRVARPRVLLVDVEGSPSVPEFRIICRALEAAGYDADWAAFGDLARIDGRLVAHGRPVDVIYRRALVEDVLDPDNGPGAAALLTAVRGGAVAMLNPFPARVANNKKVLALLADPAFAHLLLDDEERDVVATTVPWTRVLATGSTTLLDGTSGNLQAFAAAHRRDLVLKPASDYGGRNVHLGAETDAAAWDALVHAHAGTGDWIVQERLAVPRGDFPVVEDGRIVMRGRYCNINPFAIGGRYAGMITRISEDAVINVSAGGGLLPCVAVAAAGERVSGAATR